MTQSEILARFLSTFNASSHSLLLSPSRSTSSSLLQHLFPFYPFTFLFSLPPGAQEPISVRNGVPRFAFHVPFLISLPWVLCLTRFCCWRSITLFLVLLSATLAKTTPRPNEEFQASLTSTTFFILHSSHMSLNLFIVFTSPSSAFLFLS